MTRKTVDIDEDNNNTLIRLRGAFMRNGIDIDNTAMLNMVIEVGAAAMTTDYPQLSPKMIDIFEKYCKELKDGDLMEKVSVDLEAAR